MQYISRSLLLSLAYFITLTIYSSSVMANHGDLWTECKDYEELGTASVRFVGFGSEEYIDLPEGETTFTVVAEGELVGGYCEVWAYNNNIDRECVVINR